MFARLKSTQGWRATAHEIEPHTECEKKRHLSETHTNQHGNLEKKDLRNWSPVGRDKDPSNSSPFGKD